MAGTVWPMAWRWQRLLLAQGIPDRLAWLVRAYFVAYTAGQILPTSIGGDAMRIFETSRRHPGHAGPITGTVLLERALGGAATVTLAAFGFVLAVGSYDIGAYIWVELGFVARDRAARRPALLAPRAAAARVVRAAAAAPAHGAHRALRLRGDSRVPRQAARCSEASSR